jgi:hypothetical protein
MDKTGPATLPLAPVLEHLQGSRRSVTVSRPDILPCAPSGEEERSPPLLAIGVWTTIALGGLIGMTLAGTEVGALPGLGHGHWWFSVPAGPTGTVRLIFYVSVALAVLGWLGIGAEARQHRLSTRRAAAILTVWSVPLVAGPPLFSRDVYSYTGQGLIVHQGLNPYTFGPAVLGNRALAASIASIWRHTPAPYGPLFVSISRGIVALVGNSLVTNAIAFRAVEGVGMALLVVSLPRLAGRLGADPGMALWLGALSPLVFFGFISSGHNDCLMVGLLVAGVTVSMEGHRMVGLVLCALAASVKAPAALGIVFLAAEQMRGHGGRWITRTLAEYILIPVGTVSIVTLASGLGWEWLAPNNLRIPTEIRVLTSPAVSIGIAVSRVASAAGVHASQAGTVTVLQAVGGVFAVGGICWLLFQVRRNNVVRLLAVALLIVVLAGPTLWPGYLTWGVVLLSATQAQRSKVLAVAGGLAMLAVGPSGAPMLRNYAYWAVTLAVLGAAAWLLTGRRWSTVVLGRRA